MAFDESNEVGVLQGSRLAPHVAWDRVGEERSDVSAQSLRRIHQTRFNRMVRSIEVQDEEADKLGFIWRDRRACKIGVGREDTPELRPLESMRPKLAMSRVQPKEVFYASRSLISAQGNRSERKARQNREGLECGEPIFLEPGKPCHQSSLPCPNESLNGPQPCSRLRGGPRGGALSPLDEVREVDFQSEANTQKCVQSGLPKPSFYKAHHRLREPCSLSNCVHRKSESFALRSEDRRDFVGNRAEVFRIKHDIKLSS